MKRILIILALLLSGCGSDDPVDQPVSCEGKDLFSLWELEGGGLTLDFTGMTLNNPYVYRVTMPSSVCVGHLTFIGDQCKGVNVGDSWAFESGEAFDCSVINGDDYYEKTADRLRFCSDAAMTKDCADYY